MLQKIVSFSFPSKRSFKQIFEFCTINESGTQYNQWVLARAASHNHNIERLKRKRQKDRYSIHRLTNLSFMIDMVNFDYKYNLTINEKILLLAQMNHVIEVMGKDKSHFSEITTLLLSINNEMKNPDDLICLGTFLMTLASLNFYSSPLWEDYIDSIKNFKFDEEYDELFGIVHGLRRYREFMIQDIDFLALSKDVVIPQIPIIYRNSLEVLRQYVTHNIFNLKQCRLLFEALYMANINESFFWNSVRDWLNIYIKEQLSKKQMDDYFIMKEGAIEKVLHDHGIIRPRPILQELSSIAYVLSQFGYHSWRFIEFAQDLILYTIQNGSNIYKRFEDIHEKEEEELRIKRQNQNKENQLHLNEHIETRKQEEKDKIKEMEKKYRSIFINPIHLHDQFIIHLVIVMHRAYRPKKEKNKTDSFYDKKEEVYLDPRVKKWLLIQLVKPEMRYTVKQLLQLVQCEDFLSFSQINIREFVIKKLENLRSFDTNFSELEKLMWYITAINFNVLNPLFVNFLVKNHPSEIHKLIQLVQKNQWAPYLIEVMLRLPKVVNTHERYFSFQENCYFFLFLLKNQRYWECRQNLEIQKMVEYDGQMEQLKEQIKIVTYTRGFKLTINSYFHEVLNYIDVVEFFEGGRT